jgi:hypothetical protein
MNEPLHNRPVSADKLKAALRRNMARRKAVAGTSDTNTTVEMSMRSALRREPEAVRPNEGGVVTMGGSPPRAEGGTK